MVEQVKKKSHLGHGLRMKISGDMFGTVRLNRNRSAIVDGCDMVEGQCPWMNLLCNEDKRGSKGWHAKQIVPKS